MIATDRQVTVLETLLAFLDHSPDSPENQSAYEHIESARTYALGSMPEEYALTLQMAREAINALPEEDVRRKAQGLLEELFGS